MEKIAEKGGQSFYLTSMNEVDNFCNPSTKCALIIEAKTDEIPSDLLKSIGELLLEIVIVGGNVNHQHTLLKEKRHFLLSANTITQAINYVVQSESMIDTVLIITKKESSNTLKNIINAQ